MSQKSSQQTKSLFVRNFIFGVEDSLVSTVGLLAGIAATSVDRQTILLTGGVLISVEALSMGIGSLLSQSFTEEYVDNKNTKERHPLAGALIMFVSYAVAGFVPLIPYVLLERGPAFYVSIGSSCAALFFLGFLGARFFGARGFRSGFRMLLLGGAAIVAGVLVGHLLDITP